MRAAIVGTVAIGLVLGACGGADEGSQGSQATSGNFDMAGARAFRDYPVYGLGPEFEQLPLTRVLRRSDPPSELPVRADFVSFIYGSCTPADDAGCTAPLEVQVWPACERNPSVYDWTPAEEAAIEHLTVRGAPASLYEDGRRLEISTGRSTVVIFGLNRGHVLRAAQALQGVNVEQDSASELPPPATGAVDGSLTC
jgi:hypothetical protein